MIVVNGNPTDLPPGEQLSVVLSRLGVTADARGVAVAVNGEVVPHAQWDAVTLGESARVEVLGAMQGG